MADITTVTPALNADPVAPARPRTLDEARSMARRRFKDRLERGEKIGDCDCHSETTESTGLNGAEPTARVAGVRFLDSGRTYYFDPKHHAIDVGTWVVVETSRGKEAGRVVIAPHQVRLNMLQGELKPILRRLDDSDVQKMERLKRDAATAVKTFGAKIRERGLPMKPISAEYNFDGTHLTLNFSAADRVDFRDLAKELSAIFRCRVELRQVGPRDEARLLGGLGRCGRTLCCSSWLPVYPEISMNMAKAQDLPLNPGKVSGVCGRLLCCLSYENEQYKQMKAILPRLGQMVETPSGPGMVVSLQVIKELITVRLSADNVDVVFSSVDLGFRKPEPPPPVSVTQPADAVQIASPSMREEQVTEVVERPAADQQQRSAGGRRRRRRGRSGAKPRSDGGSA
jgi:cell fate regulator YaaT (PSP1 superfamily)